MSDPILEDLVKRYPVLETCVPDIVKAYDLLVACYEKDGVVYTCGNGGSAADAQHIVAELMKAFCSKRRLSPEDKKQLDSPAISDQLEGALRAVALTGNASLYTAIANDIEPDLVFAQQVYGYGREGDVLWALSTSGCSVNVLEALKVARGRGIRTIGLTGQTGGEMASLCDACIRVPEGDTLMVQELHLPVYHTLCRMLEQRFFGDA